MLRSSAASVMFADVTNTASSSVTTALAWSTLERKDGGKGGEPGVANRHASSSRSHDDDRKCVGCILPSNSAPHPTRRGSVSSAAR